MMDVKAKDAGDVNKFAGHLEQGHDDKDNGDEN